MEFRDIVTAANSGLKTIETIRNKVSSLEESFPKNRRKTDIKASIEVVARDRFKYPFKISV